MNKKRSTQRAAFTILSLLIFLTGFSSRAENESIETNVAISEPSPLWGMSAGLRKTRKSGSSNSSDTNATNASKISHDYSDSFSFSVFHRIPISGSSLIFQPTLSWTSFQLEEKFSSSNLDLSASYFFIAPMLRANDLFRLASIPFYILAGPSLGLKVNGSAETKSVDGSTIDLSNRIKWNFATVAINAGAGLEIPLKNKKLFQSIFLQTLYSIQLNSLLKSDIKSWEPKSFFYQAGVTAKF